MKPPDILLQCNSPQSQATITADTEPDINQFRMANNLDETITNRDTYSDQGNDEFAPTNHDKLIASEQNDQYMGNHNRKTRKMSFSSLNGDPLPMTIQSLLQDLSDQDMDLTTPVIFDEDILKDDEISRNLNSWAMT